MFVSPTVGSKVAEAVSTMHTTLSTALRPEVLHWGWEDGTETNSKYYTGVGKTSLRPEESTVVH